MTHWGESFKDERERCNIKKKLAREGEQNECGKDASGEDETAGSRSKVMERYSLEMRRIHSER